MHESNGRPGGEPADDEPGPAERARIRRRDRDADARGRALMDSGAGKWFKQVLDHQARLARDADAARAATDTARRRRRKG